MLCKYHECAIIIKLYNKLNLPEVFHFYVIILPSTFFLNKQVTIEVTIKEKPHIELTIKVKPHFNKFLYYNKIVFKAVQK